MTNHDTRPQRTTVTVTCPDGFDMPAVFYSPARIGPLPGVLFIYEAFGMNQEMERIASEVSAGGYAVLLPDLMARGSWFSCIRALFRDLKAGDGPYVQDMLEARNWLTKYPGVDSERIAVMGLCVGGGFALLLSKTGLFKVSVPFYGQSPPDLDGACPIVASYGEEDGITAADRKQLAQMLEASNLKHDFKVYPGAGHSFMNRGPNAFVRTLTRILPANARFDKDAAQDSMKRVFSFLEANM